jgi:DNA-binding MarR family transcriptional regulator
MIQDIARSPNSENLVDEKRLAEALIDALPKTMNSIRCHLRASRGPELTVPQFRVLIHLRDGQNTNKFLAEKLGVSVPAMSRMVAAMTDRKLISRTTSKHDRREVQLKLTPVGLDLVNETRQRTIENLSHKLVDLPESTRTQLFAACGILLAVFDCKNS